MLNFTGGCCCRYSRYVVYDYTDNGLTGRFVAMGAHLLDVQQRARDPLSAESFYSEYADFFSRFLDAEHSANCNAIKQGTTALMVFLRFRSLLSNTCADVVLCYFFDCLIYLCFAFN